MSRFHPTIPFFLIFNFFLIIFMEKLVVCFLKIQVIFPLALYLGDFFRNILNGLILIIFFDIAGLVFDEQRRNWRLYRLSRLRNSIRFFCWEVDGQRVRRGEHECGFDQFEDPDTPPVTGEVDELRYQFFDVFDMLFDRDNDNVIDSYLITGDTGFFLL